MGYFYGLGFGMAFIIFIFGMGYSKGHHFYKPVVTLVESYYQNAKCHVTGGHIIKLQHGIVVCAKVRKR